MYTLHKGISITARLILSMWYDKISLAVMLMPFQVEPELPDLAAYSSV